MAERLHRQFADIATYSDTERTAVSIRDGVLEYLAPRSGWNHPTRSLLSTAPPQQSPTRLTP